MGRWIFLVSIVGNKIPFMETELGRHKLYPRIGYSNNITNNTDQTIHITVTVDLQGPGHAKTVSELITFFDGNVQGDPLPTDDLSGFEKLKRFLRKKTGEALALYFGTIVSLVAAYDIITKHAATELGVTLSHYLENDDEIRKTISEILELGLFEKIEVLFLLSAVPSGVHLLYGYLSSLRNNGIIESYDENSDNNTNNENEDTTSHTPMG